MPVPPYEHAAAVLWQRAQEGVYSPGQLAQLEPFVYAVAVWYARGELFERGLNLAAAAFARVVFPPQAD